MNREIFPGGLYPLSGDVESQPGSSVATVVGLQGIPLAQVFLDGGEILQYNPNVHAWTPTLRAAIQVNNVTASDDYLITVNATNIVEINGTPVG